jgi:glycosyltransferase involved in cell wall biosynthesis
MEITKATEVAVVIPAYNESATIAAIAKRAAQFVTSVTVVDDGSTDNTAELAKNAGVMVIVQPVNGGKAKALMTGIEAARKNGAIGIITLDGDGQHHPEDIPRLIAAWRQNNRRIVIGARLINREAFPKARLRANLFANFWIAWAAGLPLADSQSGFRLYPASLFDEVCIPTAHNKCFVFESEIIIEGARAGYGVVAAPIEAIYEKGARPSHFRPVYDIAQITLMVAGKLFKRGMFIPGLIRSLTAPVEIADLPTPSPVSEKSLS